MKYLILALVMMVELHVEAAYRRGALVDSFLFCSSNGVASSAVNIEGDVVWIADGGRSGDGALKFKSSAKTTSALFSLPLNVEKFQGRIIQIEADLKGKDVGRGDHDWNGPKLMFPHKTERGIAYPEAPKEFGSYDWKTVTMIYAFSKNAQDLRMSLGLEAAPGELWVDAVRFYEAEEIDDVAVVAPKNSKAEKIPRGPWYGKHNPRALRGVMSGGDMSDAAFETLEKWNVNLVRLQIRIKNKDQMTLDDWFKALEMKLDWTEEVLLRCRRHGFKVVIDLHGGPGTVATKYASFIIPEDYDPEPLKEAWRRIVRRVKDYSGVYGYDILNEPSTTLSKWDEIFLAVTGEIRKLDAKTPVITEFCHRYFEGENVIYSPHFYSPHTYTHAGVTSSGGVRWSYPGYINGVYWDSEQMRVDLEPWIRFSMAHPEARILVGEFSAVVWAKGAAEYIRDCIAVFEEYGWDWTYHAFREWSAWSIEHEGTDAAHLHPSVENPRKRVLLRAFKLNRL